MMLITGITGLSGRAFYDVLCRENYPEKLRLLVRPTSDVVMFENSPLDIELIYGDMDDADFLLKAMEGCDSVFHIADKNRMMLVVDAVLKTPTVKRVFMVSSTIVFSQFYPNSKLNVYEPQLRKLFAEKGIRYVFIRPTMIFGTETDKNLSTFIRWFKKFPVFPVVKGGKATISPICQLDVAEGFWTILKNFDDLQRDDYIISGRETMTLLEMFNILTELMGKRVIFINFPFGLAKLGVNCVYHLSMKRIDFREKLDRLTEDRAYPHEEIKAEFGFDPPPFRERVKTLVDNLK